MSTSQQVNRGKRIYRATSRQRLIAGIIFVVTAVLIVFFWLAAHGKIDVGLLLGPCGFKQQFGLPCPGCEITTSILAFFRGEIFDSFYIQPAGGFLCCVLIVSAFFAFLVGVFGLYFGFLERFFTEVKLRYLIILLVVIILAGWAVILARSLTEK